MPYGRRMSAIVAILISMSVERICGLAFTLLRTVPLIPIDAFARAYSLYRGEIVVGSSCQFQMDFPAYPRSTVPSMLSQWLSMRRSYAGMDSIVVAFPCRNSAYVP